MAEAPPPDPPIDANNTEANRYLDQVARLIDSLQAGMQEAQEERDALQTKVDDLEEKAKGLEEKVEELEDEVADGWTEEDAERRAEELILLDVQAFTAWGMAAGADPTFVRPLLTEAASEAMREYAIRNWVPPDPDVPPADRAAVVAAMAAMCEKGTAPPEVVAAYKAAQGKPLVATLDLDQPETEEGVAALNRNIDPALEGFA